MQSFPSQPTPPALLKLTQAVHPGALWKKLWTWMWSIFFHSCILNRNSKSLVVVVVVVLIGVASNSKLWNMDNFVSFARILSFITFYLKHFNKANYLKNKFKNIFIYFVPVKPPPPPPPTQVRTHREGKLIRGIHCTQSPFSERQEGGFNRNS